jgi:hypothetical protein
VASKKLALALEAIAHKVTTGGTLRMGFLEGAKYVGEDEGLPIAQVAFWNEFGTIRAPARPAFRTTIADRSGAWGKGLGASIVAHDYDGEAALKDLGQAMRDDLESSIATWSTPPNAPSTIAKKGFNDPLIDSGQMQRAPAYEIVK